MEADFEVRYLRRTERGLLEDLRLAFEPEAVDAPIETAWRTKEEQTGRPLIVFLDQVEEVYTRAIDGVPDEFDQLLEALVAMFRDPDRRPKGKLVLSFRKEWLAELEAELSAYGLPRTRVFLEPLDRRGIIEIVRGPTQSERLRQQYHLEVEDALAETIADDLLKDRDAAVAPTLQILLTRMFLEAKEENAEHPRLSLAAYERLKREGILLGDFLDQQMEAFREHYPEAVESGLLLDIVALHTTAMGTSDHRAVDELEQEYCHLRGQLPNSCVVVRICIYCR